MTTEHLMDDVRRDEGFRSAAYPDPLSGGDPWTIGYGHTGPDVARGMTWTQAQCDEALFKDLAHAESLMDDAIPWWRSLDDARQDVLSNMCFNMGWGSLSGFHHTLEAVRLELYAAAAEGMLASKWAKQVGARATRLAEQMRTGVRAPSPADQDTEADDVTGGPDPA